MKFLTQSLFIGVFAISLAACGSNKSNTTTGMGVGAGGYYNPVTGQWTSGGCAPLSSGQISFTIQGASVSNTQILGGPMPGGTGSYGTSTVGTGAGYGYGYGYGGYGGSSLMKSSNTGTLTLSSISAGSVTGSIQLSQYALSMLMSSSGGYGGYGTTGYGASGLCVSGVSVNAVYTNAQDAYPYSPFINQALVYLTINGSQILVPFY